MYFPVEQSQQLPLIHIIDRDNAILRDSPKNEWYRILESFDWESYRHIAAAYYDALYAFNKQQAQDLHDSQTDTSDKTLSESKAEAEQRILFDRATLNEDAPILFQDNTPMESPIKTDPKTVAPGVVPPRLYGRAPKCFFALFKSFMGASLMGFSPEPEVVYNLLVTNLPFARICGFIPKGANERYFQAHVPSLRKLEQFDQILTQNGLWSRQKWAEVRKNITMGVIQPEREIVGDTTHYHAHSGFITVVYEDKTGNKQKKSQSKLTKTCSCKDKEQCAHQWELADEGAGTIVKSKTKMYWGHKASIVGLPKQGIPLDVVAVSDAATFDGQTFHPHVKRLFENLPEVRDWFDRALYDSACDDEELKNRFEEDFGLKLKASQNPRSKKEITDGLPRGMFRLTPNGDLICRNEKTMDYQGTRWDTEKFIYGPPRDETGGILCNQCDYQSDCCPNATKGRTTTISFDLMSHIDPNDPPMAKRFKAIMSRRPSVERMIKRIKCDFSDDNLTKRGNASFQANLDKTMIAFHMMLRES